ncbi:MAG: carbohydrate ABC transporter permease [Clostridia bacterium]|nr:carbohydrate ABC transporter permease [Clostridia bacterium]
MPQTRNKIEVGLSRKVFVICNTLLFALLLFVCFYPLWYVFIQSLSDSNRATQALILPVGLTLDNYVQLIQMPEIFNAFIVSILRTVIGTAGTVFCCMYAGYLFTKETLPFRKFWYRMLVITMYVGGGLIPTYLVYKSYGLLNTFGVYVIPSLIGAYYVILIKTFVEQLPSSLVESAKIDGASEMRVFVSIILPLSLPIAATIAIYCTNGQWNSWFDNQLYTVTDKNLTTLQFLLYNYLNKAEKLIEKMEEQGATSDEVARLMTPRGIKMTVTMISVIPIMCVYPFMQRYLIKGIMIGAIKG